MSDSARAQSLYESGKFAEAAALCREILAKNPRDAQAAQLLSILLLQSGALADAEHYAKLAVVADMRNAEYHFLLGTIYQAQGNIPEAAKALDRALHMDPTHMGAFSARAKIAFDMEDFATAERVLLPMLERFPDMPDILLLMVRIKKEQKKYKEVVKFGDRILQLKPDIDNAEFLLQYGLALGEVGRLHESITYHERVISMLEKEESSAINETAKAEIYYNMALGYENFGAFDTAERYYERALAINPDYNTCRFAYETLLIKRSDLERDLSCFSMRFLMKGRHMREYAFPEWHGEPLDGKRLLIWAEQGIGDIAMYAGFLPYVLSRTKAVTLDMFPYLVDVFKQSFPEIPIITCADDGSSWQPQPAGAFDYHIPMGSLVTYLLKDYKPRVIKGYLKPHPQRVVQLRERYAALGPGLKVGISWRTVHPNTRFRRDIPLEEWGPILKTPDCHFISLQYTDEEPEIEMARQRFGVDILLDKDVQPLLSRNDFVTQIAAMDLVVSIQNSAVHMGGATGTDTILMLSRAADFRWGVTPSDSVFYPTVQIVRQPEYGDWSPVVSQVAQMVKAKAASRK